MKIKMNPVSQNLDAFLLDCEVRGLQQISIDSYKQRISAFLKDYEFTQEGINQFIIDSRNRGNHTATINSYLRPLKVYNNYLDAGLNIKFLKQEEIIKDIYTPEEIQRLIKRPNTKNFSEFKTWALINFLIGTGCRISTALELKVEDVDFNAGYVCFRHMKNHKQQFFPISKALETVLRQYIAVRGDSGYLFCNMYGDKSDKRSVQQLVADYNKARGVNKTSCHLFRHCFAANYIRNGGDIYRLQHLLGHSTLEMSAHYAKLYSDDLKYNLEEYSPLDNNIKTKIRLWLKLNMGLFLGPWWVQTSGIYFHTRFEYWCEKRLVFQTWDMLYY